MNTLPRPLLFLFAAVLATGSLAACQTTEEVADETEEAVEAGTQAAEETAEAAYEEISEFTSEESIYVAEVGGTQANEGVSGTAFFRYRDDSDEVRIQGSVEGLSEGAHGFHVHQNGSCAMQGGTPAGAAGGHYNPDDTPHGAPGDSQSERHVGDFGNIQAGADGVAQFSVSYDRDGTDLDELQSRALIVHEGRDDLTSQPSGAAGARVGCAVLTSVSASEAQAMMEELGMM